jgi:uncharacterized membrane protein
MQTQSKRLFPLDALRGLIIVFMALDHANYFIAQQHSSGEHWGGGLPVYHSALPFLTRLVTHFSAPGFFFLMGVGMLLFTESRRKQDWSTWKIIGHFWIRGLILIALQLFVINPIWKAGPEFFPEIYIGVLIALGVTMMLGSLFLNLPPIALLILTLVLLVGTEWLHPDPVSWGMLTIDVPNMLLIRSGGNGYLWSNYPAFPWLELVLFGMLFGKWLRADHKKAYKTGFWLGIGLLTLFVIVRYFDGFGNIRPRAGGTWIDFLNVVKYPPSMVFTFMTMGVNLLLLWGFSRTPPTSSGLSVQTASKFLVTFGCEPLFMYVTHLALYMLIGKWLVPHGSSIPAMLPYWLLGLVILYPLANWYGKFKQKQPPNSIWRFL